MWELGEESDERGVDAKLRTTKRRSPALVPANRRHQTKTHLLFRIAHGTPGGRNLAKDLGIGKSRILGTEVVANSILELEVGRGGTFGGVGILGRLLRLLFLVLLGLFVLFVVGRLRVERESVSASVVGGVLVSKERDGGDDDEGGACTKDEGKEEGVRTT